MMAVRFTSWFLPTTGTTSKFKACSGAEQSSQNIIEQESINLLMPLSPKASHLHTTRSWIYFSLPLLLYICDESYGHNWKDLILTNKTKKKPHQKISFKEKNHKQNPSITWLITKMHLSDVLLGCMSNSRNHKQISQLKSRKGISAFFFPFL